MIFETTTTLKALCSNYLFVEFEVTIELQPIWNFFNITKNIYVSGCRYKSPTNMYHYSYWLLNGTDRIPADSKELEADSYELTGIVLPISNVSIQCVIENENMRGKKVISDKAAFLDLRKSTFFLFISKYQADQIRKDRDGFG